MGKRGYLILENGRIFEGVSFGAETNVFGEVVFNTGMVGYPEGFTDPSYYGQILTMTYPLIGNYGVPLLKAPTEGKVPKVPKGEIIKASGTFGICDTSDASDIPPYFESNKIQISGLIVSSYIDDKTHWQAEETLSSWLKREGVPALSGIDSRTLTQTLREYGVMKGAITFDNPDVQRGNFYDINKDNLAAKVSFSKPIIYPKGKLRLLLIDCGVKLNQIRMLLDLDTTVIRVPWNYNPFAGGNKFKFDAVFITNGPGDPKMVKETITTVKQVIEAKIPTLGVCLGNQILALAAGADTYKLKYGHRGQNQPVRDQLSNKCYITTQNHGFAVDIKTLPAGWLPWFTNLNDATNEGVRHKTLPFWSTQFHPEAAPGPTDTGWLFEFFIKEAKKWLKKN
jgi:carbamoyl-phosphate synthase small subunit